MTQRLAGTLLPSLILSLSLSQLAQAQDQTPTPTPTSAPTSSGGTLQQMVVTGAQIPINESVIPTVRNTGMGYGMDLNVKDIPRNVTIISREQLDDISITDVRDFTKLTTSSYTQSNFGAPANPSIRGQTADVFVNGMRTGLTSNGNGMPIDFNSVESVDIFKGPPTVVYGASNYVGGYINLDTKRPYFDRLQGSVSGTVGMYDQYRWNLDVGGPIIQDKLAFRLSYSGENSGSYYENGLKETHSIYAALTWTPTDRYTLAVNADYYFGSYTENWGWNRPTQNLIDNGKYFTGTVPGAPFTIFGGANPIVPSGTANLDPQVRLLKPGDGSYGQNFRGQAIQTLVINDNLTLVNNTLVQYINRHTKSSYFYGELIDPAFSIENRTELHINFDVPLASGSTVVKGYEKDGKTPIAETTQPFVLRNQINTGLDLRYTEVTAYNDFFDEPANAWDLSLGRSLIDYKNFSFVFPVPGHPGWTATPGTANGDTNYSKVFILGPYYQHSLDIGEHFSLLAGARADVIWVSVNDPLSDEAGLGPSRGDNTVAVEPNFNISPVFKPWKWLTTYFTYNYSQSYAVGNGGGFPATHPINMADELHKVSDLFEVGAKASLLQDTLFINAALFLRDGNDPSVGGATVATKVKGFEIEADYQPNRNFYVTAGYSYLNAFVHGSPGFVASEFPVDDPRSLLANGQVLTDPGVTLPHGVYREPGLPHHLFNFLARYQIPTDWGTFGAILGATVTGPYFLGYNGYVTIPWQHELDLTLFYKTKDDHFEAKLAFLNLTNQRNFSPPNPVYGYDSVVVDWPFHLEGTITFKF